MISERVLAHPKTACIGTFLSSDVCADEIAQRIIQAYVQLVFQAPDEDGLRTITVAQLQAIEVRLTELSQSKADPKIPPFWLKIFSLPDFASIDSYGCFDFDEAELATAVDLVLTVARNSSN